MNSSQYDVVIVGAGAAGLTAAIGLARSGFAVAVLEAAAYPGAENWSGCVYFCENLAHPDILGPEGVEALAWERRLVERGSFACDGQSLLGMTYRDPEAFRHCYTVLRPIYDHHLAQVAIRLGVALLSETTVESLIRDGERVIGVCTQRGPLYADLVFLAEGDASHLVTREGYERYTDQREVPKFLQGIKQVIDLPPGAVERLFGVGPGEGVAYELLLRNGSLRGRRVHLNMGGFVYTNRQSLSIGLVLPADNLHEHFEGDPNLLMEWFASLPALEPWLKDGRRGVFGAKIIRGGGARDIPNLIDEGLAIGGAASAIGVDFPYPNFTGPATAMGLLLAQAARRIREEGGRFTRDNLHRHYLEPLRRTHYWRDVEFLRRWPGYVKKTRVFFDRNLDLALGSAYVWTRRDHGTVGKWTNWVRFLKSVAGPAHWGELRQDARHLMRALRVREVAQRPSLGRLLLDGSINALRDLFRRPRPNVPTAGTIRLRYRTAEGEASAAALPGSLQRWFRRFAPVLAASARRVYENDTTSLEEKLPSTTALLVRQVNMLDLLGVFGLGLATGITSAWLSGWDRLRGLFRGWRPGQPVGGLYPRYALAAKQATDLTPLTAPAAQQWEARLAQLAYQTVKTSHIHVIWPKTLPEKDAVVSQGLWHVCPAHVYEARVSPLGQVQVVVNFENCIKCETCWRTSDLVDWGRDGQHRFVYPVHSPVLSRLLEAVQEAGQARPAPPRLVDPWELAGHALAERLKAERPEALNGRNVGFLGEMCRLVDKLERKIQQFDDALAEEPRTVDRARAEHLEMLARYAQQLAANLVDVLRDSPLATHPGTAVSIAFQQLRELTNALAAKAEERARRTWNQHFSWAAGGGRQLHWHHLAGLRRLLDVLGKYAGNPTAEVDPLRPWLRAEEDAAAVAGTLTRWSDRLDAVFPSAAWRDLERHQPLTSEQDAVLRDLLAQVPLIDPAKLAETMHPPSRKALLAELGRRDPSLAYRAACHLWARDLARLASGPASWTAITERWQRADEWACFAAIDGVRTTEAGWKGEALFVPAAGARNLLLLLRDRLVIVTQDDPRLKIEPLATLGLRGAGLVALRLEEPVLPDQKVAVDGQRIERLWSILSAADLVSIASGMADLLCRRAASHAMSRVQFPGLFHDEEARDTIGKFGAIKKMIAEMAARRYLIETLDHTLSPVDFSGSTLERVSQVKATVAEALGTALGSLVYNAGQVFGGTGYSEDDLLAKFYRDAAAWRFLGPANVEVHRRHGRKLLDHWRQDGQALAGVPGEMELFEQLAQRKALQADLDEIRNARSRLRGLAGEIVARNEGGSARAEELAEAAELLARQDGQLLASKALLLRTHARLETGLPAEVESALVRVWLEAAAVSLEECEGQVRRRLERARGYDDRPVVEPEAGPPVTVYADFLAAPTKYDSGDFLVTSVDLRQPRYVPEMVRADPALAARKQELEDLMVGQFGRPRARGLSFERYIEQQHRPDPEDLDFCREHGFFRMPIPRDLGGEGRPKVDYYLLTTTAQRLADVAISLTIQANSSIGTTPVLLARDKDLPRAQKELGAFVGDHALQREVQTRLEELLGLQARGENRRLEPAVGKLQRRLEETVLAQSALTGLMNRFLAAWQQVGKTVSSGTDAGKEAMRAGLEQALAAWKEVVGSADERHAELGRRRQACDLFLRWVSSGQISAFALTEPSAGSDTARVSTRARLHSVPVEAIADGVFRFVPEGAKEPNNLLDAERLDFRAEPNDASRSYRAYYRYSETAEPALIRFDEYDYETDDPRRLRYFEHDGRRIHFTDIAYLRKREDRLWYDYWELTGAKMWITNGRMSGIMCLYAKTEEGVTGFIVDRHAEGLVVGKDEAKMGQLGSPTNELSLQAVRVPRENVLGLEGRGQVNALETLNVGRAGLAMSAMAQMEGLIERSRDFARGRHGDIPDWVQWRLERMEEDRFTAEALAHDVIGRFEHPRTKSVRMESAIAKMLVSELLHDIIETAEEIHGLDGQTQRHLVEKRKRDARILNIYEGTNEVQRFSILKDLAMEVGPRWSRAPAVPPTHLGREALELEALKGNARKRIEAALEFFGAGLWQNPNLQANCFLLAEIAAWLKAADSTLGRLAWLERQQEGGRGEAEGGREVGPTKCSEKGEKEETFQSSLPPSPSPLPPLIGRRALARCYGEVRDRLRRFDEELTYLRRGYYAPEIRAASLVFRTAEAKPETPTLVSRINRPLSVLVIVEPSVGGVPQPYVADGRLLEPHRTLSDSDRAALETVLRLRDQAAAPVMLQVAAVGSKLMVLVLREALSLGADRALLVIPEGEAVTADCAAAALAAVLGTNATFDLILGGSGVSGQEEGVLARLTAEALGVPCAGSASQLAVQADDQDAHAVLADAEGRSRRIRSLPAEVAIEAGVALRRFTVAGYLAGLARPVEMVRWPRKVPERAVTFLEGTQAAAAVETGAQPHPLTPPEAARQILDALGLSGTAIALSPFDGDIEDVSQPTLLESRLPSTQKVVAVLTTEAEGQLSPMAALVVKAGQMVAASVGAELAVLLVARPREEIQRLALAQLQPFFSGDIVLLTAAAAEKSPEMESRLLMDCWPNLKAAPRAVVGEPWTEAGFAALAARSGKIGGVVLRVRRLTLDQRRLVVDTSRAGGKLHARQTLDLEGSATRWLTLAGEVEIEGAPSPSPGKTIRVQRWSPRLERFYSRSDIQHLLEELKQEIGVVQLADADFIIDAGFGVGNRDGYEAVIAPLEQALRDLGVRNLVVGGSRKVTEELHLLPADRQIGQSGVSVNPRVLLAIGISGAPQHLNYIGPRATILAFNRDPEAPLMTLNQRQPKPRVFPVVGDLFDTVPALTASLREEHPVHIEPKEGGVTGIIAKS